MSPLRAAAAAFAGLAVLVVCIVGVIADLRGPERTIDGRAPDADLVDRPLPTGLRAR